MKNQKSIPSSFLHGFISGAATGALMVGIFYGSMALLNVALPGAGIALTASWNLFGVFAASVFSTGMFSGIMSAHRAHKEANAALSASHPAPREATERAHAPNYAPVLVPAMERAVDTQQQWTTRIQPGGGQRDTISTILASRAPANSNQPLADRIDAAREEQRLRANELGG